VKKKALAFEALRNRNKSVKEIAKALSVGEATVYRYQRELKENGKLIWATSKDS
jgi:transposase